MRIRSWMLSAGMDGVIRAISESKSLLQRRRMMWLGAGVAVAVLLLSGSQALPPASLPLVLLLCGVILAVGRQGFELLVVRTLAALLAWLLIGTLVVGWSRSPLCASVADCAHFLALLLFGVVLLGA